MAQMNIKIDDELNTGTEALLIPFEITTKADPFWNEANQAHLKKVITDLDAGKGLIVKTMEELEAMEE